MALILMFCFTKPLNCLKGLLVLFCHLGSIFFSALIFYEFTSMNFFDILVVSYPLEVVGFGHCSE